jgi:uncharacterized FlaG/YvyC family protein
MDVEKIGESVKSHGAELPSHVAAMRRHPAAETAKIDPRGSGKPANPHRPTSNKDVVELTTTERTPSPVEEANAKDYRYELSEGRDLIVKIVNPENRSEIIRQYPSEEMVNFRTAYRRFLKIVGLEA